ncbi:hypothetical protein Vafri_11801 [Volvox africanus]|uniref:Uncharacterized protein n=1 Tax=Volvox africanus TaxID=51714 RepID=A0A8J4B906_9CHLO|nr:hypothetical protein Vafri_11801 [Volvox africanus]
MPELEAEQWRMALDSLVPEVAAAFEEWLRSMAPDGEGSQQVVREAHFMERLRQVAAMCGPGGGSCRRLVAVVGRAHAARLRRALQQQHQQDEQVQQMPLRKNRGL